MRTTAFPCAARLARTAVLAAAVLGLSPGVAAAPPARGSEAPAIDLNDLKGDHWTLAGERGRPVVVIFGELYHEGTLLACGDVRDAIGSAGFARDSIATALVVAQDVAPADLFARAVDARLPPVVLHDRSRRVYGAYRVIVMPTIVVVGSDGRIVHGIASRTPRLRETVIDALLVALGRLEAEQFEATLRARAEGADDLSVRVGRMVELARQLERRGLDELADTKLREAIELDSESSAARIALGMMLLERDRLPQAEEQFRLVLGHDPRSTEARLGLAWVHLRRAGPELAEAESMLHELIAIDRADARAHHLLGLVYERGDRMAEAAASFRNASELLLARVERWGGDQRSTSDER